MADELELLRLRAKAKLKLRGQSQEQQPEAPTKPRVPTFTEQRLPFMAEGVKSLRQGNTVAGGLDIANQMFSEATRPFQLADEQLRKVPFVGEPISNILRIPPYLAGKAVEVGTEAISATGIPQMLNNLLPLDESGRTAEALGRTNQMIAPFLVAPPIVKGAAGVPKVAARGSQAVADMLTQSAYKVPPSIKAGERTEILRTAQREGIAPTKKGIEKLDNRVSELKSIAENLEERAMQSGGETVKTSEIVQSIDGLVEKWSKSDTPKDFTKILNNYREKVLSQKKSELDIREMIDLKRNLQKQLSDVYLKQMKINPSVKETLLQEAKSSIETNVRQKLEELIPEYSDVNSRMHKMLKLKPYVEQAANRISNQDLTTVRLKDIMFGGGAGAAGSDPIGIATAIVIGRVLTDPRTQAVIGNKIAPTGKIPSFTSAVASSTRAFQQFPLNRNDEE